MAEYRIRLANGNEVTIPLEAYMERVVVQRFEDKSTSCTAYYQLDADRWVGHDVAKFREIGELESIGPVKPEDVPGYQDQILCPCCNGPTELVWETEVTVSRKTGPVSVPIKDPETGEHFATFNLIPTASGPVGLVEPHITPFTQMFIPQ